MNNLINFIYDLKDTVRTKQNNATLNSQNFILNNFENEINAIKIGDFFDFDLIFLSFKARFEFIEPNRVGDIER